MDVSGSGLEKAVPVLTCHISRWQEKTLPEDIRNFLVSTGLPKVTLKLLNDGPYVTSEQACSVHLLLRKVLEVFVAEGFASSSVLVSEALIAIFDPVQMGCFYSHINQRFPLPPDLRIVMAQPAATCPSEMSSTYVCDHINYFTHLDGFKVMFKHMESSSLPVVKNMITAISKTIDQKFLLGPMVVYCVEEVYNFVQTKLSSLKREDLQWGRKDDFRTTITDILAKTKTLMYNIPHLSMNTTLFSLEMTLKVTLQCHYSEIFDKRLLALENITNWVHRYSIAPGPNVEGPLLPKEELIKWLIENKIIPVIFGKARHGILIKQSEFFYGLCS